MKKIFVAIALLLACSAEASVRADLIKAFRNRVNEVDTAVSNVSDTTAALWAQQAQDKVVVMGGYLNKSVDIVIAANRVEYNLPQGFRVLTSCMIKGGSGTGIWQGVLPNQDLLRDTTVYNYTLDWKGPDSARIYIRGLDLAEGDTVRVGYRGMARALSTTNSVVEVPTDDEIWIIEEMIAMYLEYNHNWQVMLAKQQATRMDMGVMKAGQK